jgi:hypothetical protein
VTCTTGETGHDNSVTSAEKRLEPFVTAFEDLPILARLEYVKALIVNRAHGDASKEPELIAASDIIRGVMRDLEATVPRRLLTELVGS